jgi:D-alanyl-lipoteichoic acid acyltransferase DltB (MBOAT superfamily)
MTFNSIDFAFFFVVVVLLHFVLPHRWRWVMLLAASCHFYMAFIPYYILILAFTIFVDYVAGIMIGGAAGARRKLYLVASILANVGVLAVFKYYAFIDENLTVAAQALGWNYTLPALGIVLPIGLSFHTFQSLSYTIEVYRGHQQSEKHLGIFALYVLFFPQLVAGPIERPQNLLRQLRMRHNFDTARLVSGLQLMLWGLFKKVAIADVLAVYVNTVYGDPNSYQGLPVLLATYGFAFQIYCDFSGYTDIAIGAARVLGYDLMQNFRQPYFARSIAEFWSRWHISLSSWFRDYLYIPLGGNRVAVRRLYFNIAVVFMVSGLWHGARWTFVVWGALHASYLLTSMSTRGLRDRIAQGLGLDRYPRLRRTWQIFATFHLALLGWVFFRAESFDAAFTILRNMWRVDVAGLLAGQIGINIAPQLGRYEMFAACLALLALLAVDSVNERGRGVWDALAARPLAVRWAAYAALALAILNLGIAQEIPFIYFQF